MRQVKRNHQIKKVICQLALFLFINLQLMGSVRADDAALATIYSMDDKINELKNVCSKDAIDLDTFGSVEQLKKTCLELTRTLEAKRQSIKRLAFVPGRVSEAQGERAMHELTKAESELEKTKSVMALANQGETAYMKFIGINWGLGLAFTDIGGSSYIEEAKLVDGLVRVEKSFNSSASLMFETHYFIKESFFGGTDKSYGHGPFAALEFANEDRTSIGSFAVGWMWGFRTNKLQKESWNIGVGYYVNTKVRQLGDGIVEGQPLPGNETEIRFKEVDRSGLAVLISYTFF